MALKHVSAECFCSMRKASDEVSAEVLDSGVGWHCRAFEHSQLPPTAAT
jgi:hypothetical protein